MNYGLLQYFKDQLRSWTRNLEVHDQESSELVRQLGVATQLAASSADHEKTSRLVDQLMVQQQQFSFLVGQIADQQLRLERLLFTELIDDAARGQQTVLQTRMHSNERTFLRTKYACSEYLASLFKVRLTHNNGKDGRGVVR